MFPVSANVHVMGAIICGGASRRFGRPKALATVGGQPIINRVRNALRDAGMEPHLITHHPDLFSQVDLPSRSDSVPAAGPLGGIHAALQWATNEGHIGSVCVPCDAPFLAAGLLRALAERANSNAVVLPESGGRRGIEPLCAFYPVACLPDIERQLARGEYRLTDLLHGLATRRIPLSEVRHWGEPDHIFLNVNTPEDHRRAEELVRE